MREFAAAYGIEKSAVSEHFVRTSREKLRELLERPLDKLTREHDQSVFEKPHRLHFVQKLADPVIHHRHVAGIEGLDVLNFNFGQVFGGPRSADQLRSAVFAFHVEVIVVVPHADPSTHAAQTTQ